MAKGSGGDPNAVITVFGPGARDTASAQLGEGWAAGRVRVGPGRGAGGAGVIGERGGVGEDLGLRGGPSVGGVSYPRVSHQRVK